MRESTLTGRRADSCGVGLSRDPDSEEAGREAVRTALAGHSPTADDLVILFTSVDHDNEALYRAAAAEAAPAGVLGCTSMGGFTHAEQVPSGCVAALLAGDESSFAVCHVERDDVAVADCARRAVEVARDRAGDRYPNSLLVLLTDGLTPAQRAEVAATPPAPVPVEVEVDEDAPIANADGSYTEVTKNGHTVTSFYLNGNLNSPIRLLHREDGPAQIVVDPDGTRHEWWYERGVHHRDGGPAVTKTSPDGSHSETYYVRNKLHREDGPAVTVVNGLSSTEEYYEHGRQHREDGPAVIITFPNGKRTRYWYYHGRQRSSYRLLRALAGRNGYGGAWSGP